MSDFLGKVKDPQVLEVIEGLLNLCMEREKEIAELALEVESLRHELGGASPDEIIVADPEGPVLARRDVMVADGADWMRYEVEELLVKHGFKVVARAKDGREAVRLYKEKHPALVTMDTHMPVLDGYQATRRILEYDPDARVVILSRVRDRSMVLEAIMCGAMDYVCKPFQPQRLLASVYRLLAG